MGEEVELKLDLAGGAGADIRTLPLLAGTAPAVLPQFAIYYDTSAGKLARAGVSLRVRRSAGRWIQTVKRTLPGEGLLQRGEWEWEVADEQPDVAKLGELSFDLDGTIPKLARKLEPVLRTEIQRTSWLVERNGSHVQVDLDLGQLTSGDRSTPVAEVEFELIEGSRQALTDLAREVAGCLPVRLGVLSKADRGAALREGRLGAPRKAEPVRVTADMRAADALSAIGQACLKHYRQNEDVVLALRQPEALHQARVALRRLRAAFTLFKPVIAADTAYPALRSELRWFTAQLGDARDLDVYLKRDLPEEELQAVSRAREQAYDRVIEAMNDARSRLLVIDLAGWLALGSWRGESRAVRPITPFAAKRLDRLWGAVEPTGRRLEQMGEEERHRLRIEVKKMRYAVEFFTDLYRPSKAKKHFVASIEALQEALGLLNDIATARTLTAATASDAPQEQADRLSHLRVAEQALARLGRAGPFWRSGGEGRSREPRRQVEPSDEGSLISE